MKMDAIKRRAGRPAKDEIENSLQVAANFRADDKVAQDAGISGDIAARVVVENYGRNSRIKRLQANKCEWCGAENVPLEVHHVRRLKELSGKKQWEIAMIGCKRKTMALCIDCHDKLQAGNLE